MSATVAEPAALWIGQEESMTHSRMRVGGAALALLLVGGLAVQWYRNAAPPAPIGVTLPDTLAPRAAASTVPAAPAASSLPPPTGGTAAASPAPPAPSAAGILIHVVGAVRHPGLYHLASNARLADALHAAGGPKRGADLEAVNLASRVQDGEQIRVPTLAERAVLRPARPAARAAHPTPATRPPRPTRTTARYPLSASATTPAAATAHATSEASGPVNINTAGAEELDSLPGVGPATAAAILEFRREHGPFQRVEDLLEVRGIGEKKLAAMRDRVVIQ
jgi:competence protein ComEA